MPSSSGAALRPVPATSPATSPTIASDKVRLQFATFDCSCSLGNVHNTLFELTGVREIDWDYDAATCTLTVTSQNEPSNEIIRKAIEGMNVSLKEITRP